MKKFFIPILICFIATISIADDENITILRVGYLPLFSQIPIVVSYENDRINFKKIQVELIKFTSFTSIEAALRVGSIHAAIAPIPIILSIASDMYECKLCNIKIVGAINKGGSLLVSREQGAIKTLRGKLIGVPGLDSVEIITLMQIMQDNDLHFGLDYKALGITFDTAIRDLKSDKLQALYLPEPWGSIAEKETGAFLIENQTLFGSNQTTLLVISKSMLEKKTDAVTEWIGSIVNACKYIENDIDKTGARQTAIIQNKYFNISNDIVMNSLAKRKGGIQFIPKVPDIDQIKSILSKMTEIKWIMKSVDIVQLIDTKIFEKVIQKP
ncbi:ABC transporter substrate-binding protein [Candidatus Magnetomorum sp. HK-1]|nr:ABC transporter substrate-binding protein [Candidatus Magnetomorum sp. HK-1]